MPRRMRPRSGNRIARNVLKDDPIIDDWVCKSYTTQDLLQALLGCCQFRRKRALRGRLKSYGPASPFLREESRMDALLSVSGKALRMRRVVPASGKCLMVPLDHSLADGPIALRSSCGNWWATSPRTAATRSSCTAAAHAVSRRERSALVVHLNGCTRYAEGRERCSRASRMHSHAARTRSACT